MKSTQHYEVLFHRHEGNPILTAADWPYPAHTVFNAGADKESFNVTPPSQQDDAGKPFRGNVAGVLQALGWYDAATANGLAAALIPDVITYDTASSSTNILNGRALADDVIDAELGIVTQGGIPSDCVGQHTDYLSAFPYLGNPH